MIRFLRAQLVLLILFVLLLIIIRTMGTLHQANWFAAMLAEDAHLSADIWCWRGLCPGQTPYSTVRSDIQRWFPGYETLTFGTVLSWEQTSGSQHWSGRVSGTDTKPLTFAQIRPMQNTFTFGDALFQFGQPTRVQIHGYIGYQTWLIFVYYDHGIYTEMVMDEPRLRPTQAVLSISFDTTGQTTIPTDFYPRRNTINGWHGFSLLR